MKFLIDTPSYDSMTLFLLFVLVGRKTVKHIGNTKNGKKCHFVIETEIIQLGHAVLICRFGRCPGLVLLSGSKLFMEDSMATENEDLKNEAKMNFRNLNLKSREENYETARS